MRREDCHLHNVAAVVDTPHGPQPRRVPESVRVALNDEARHRMTVPAGVEVRYVPGDDAAGATLSCPDGTARVVPFWGPIQSGESVALGPEPTTVSPTPPDRLAHLDPDVAASFAFDPGVCRLCLQGDPVCFHGTDGDLRPPRPAELPDRTHLAYGTSITEGWSASGPHLPYAAGVARRRGTDLRNLGSSGSAYCEPELADHVAGRTDWDLATLEVSVNMLRAGFSTATFRERVRYLVETVADAHPEKPVVCVTLWPFFGDVCGDLEREQWASTPGAYRQTLREVADDAGRNVHVVAGPDLLDVDGLGGDLLHPRDHGMVQMADRLADELDAIEGSG